MPMGDDWWHDAEIRIDNGDKPDNCVVGSSSSNCPTALLVDSHDPLLQPRRRLIQRTRARLYTGLVECVCGEQ